MRTAEIRTMLARICMLIRSLAGNVVRGLGFAVPDHSCPSLYRGLLLAG